MSMEGDHRWESVYKVENYCPNHWCTTGAETLLTYACGYTWFIFLELQTYRHSS